MPSHLKRSKIVKIHAEINAQINFIYFNQCFTSEMVEKKTSINLYLILVLMWRKTDILKLPQKSINFVDLLLPQMIPPCLSGTEKSKILLPHCIMFYTPILSVHCISRVLQSKVYLKLCNAI